MDTLTKVVIGAGLGYLAIRFLSPQQGIDPTLYYGGDVTPPNTVIPSKPGAGVIQNTPIDTATLPGQRTMGGRYVIPNPRYDQALASDAFGNDASQLQASGSAIPGGRLVTDDFGEPALLVRHNRTQVGR